MNQTSTMRLEPVIMSVYLNCLFAFTTFLLHLYESWVWSESGNGSAVLNWLGVLLIVGSIVAITLSVTDFSQLLFLQTLWETFSYSDFPPSKLDFNLHDGSCPNSLNDRSIFSSCSCLSWLQGSIPINPGDALLIWLHSLTIFFLFVVLFALACSFRYCKYSFL